MSDEQMTIRPAAVAGMFYPADRQQLHDDISQYLNAAMGSSAASLVPKEVIAPHAGYVYSGPVAASACARPPPAR